MFYCYALSCGHHPLHGLEDEVIENKREEAWMCDEGEPVWDDIIYFDEDGTAPDPIYDISCANFHICNSCKKCDETMRFEAAGQMRLFVV